MNNQQTASSQYEAQTNVIMNLLDEIRGDVAMHNVSFDRNGRRSWTYVADLNNVAYLLQEVADFLNNKE